MAQPSPTRSSFVCLESSLKGTGCTIHKLCKLEDLVGLHGLSRASRNLVVYKMLIIVADLDTLLYDVYGLYQEIVGCLLPTYC